MQLAQQPLLLVAAAVLAQPRSEAAAGWGAGRGGLWHVPALQLPEYGTARRHLAGMNIPSVATSPQVGGEQPSQCRNACPAAHRGKLGSLGYSPNVSRLPRMYVPGYTVPMTAAG